MCNVAETLLCYITDTFENSVAMHPVAAGRAPVLCLATQGGGPPPPTGFPGADVPGGVPDSCVTAGAAISIGS